MPIHKVTTFLSKISSFFKKDNDNTAMFTIMNVMKGIKMSEMILFGTKSKCNNVYPLLQVFQIF
ncbi:MAG: Uncultured bacterium extrachromosomal [Bacteroidetes bacterium]|nr:Uncultured bacterium extrachromosomal [Bacteroidota bacterium]